MTATECQPDTICFDIPEAKKLLEYIAASVFWSNTNWELCKSETTEE